MQVRNWENNRGTQLGGAAWIALAVLAVALVFPSLPGRMNADALDMLGQAMRGSYGDWHVPLVSWLWRAFGASPAVIAAETVLVTFAMLASVAILFRRSGLGERGAAAAAGLFGAFPPVYGHLAAVGKDTWAAAILLLLLVLSVLRQRRWFVALRGGLFALAVIIRPEMILLAPVFLGAEYLLFGRRGRQVLAFAVVVAGLLVANNQFVYKVLEAERRNPESVIFLFDLAGLSMRSGEMLLTPAAFPAQDLAVLQKHYSRDNIIPMLWGAPIEEMLVQVRGDDLRALQKRWIATILDRPGDYLAVRYGVIGPYLKGFRPYHPGIDRSGLIALYFDAANDAVNSVLDRVPQFLFSHWLPLIGSFLLVFALWRLDAARSQPVLFAYAAIGLAYQVLLLPLIVVANFRFAYGGVILFYLLTVLAIAQIRRGAIAAAGREQGRAI